MDIGPISAIRPIAPTKPFTTAPDLSRVFEVEYLGQPEDDDYTSASRKAARGLEDEEESEEPAGTEEESAAVATGAKISFFA